ncbi:GDSL esterase/lipase At5g45910-like [Rhodamnia argentea]|uniref:GDSL esterase/lipase At5g45910-like n=1 Tax=Rhodamnia argentea TaxID=178133 RepID=A0A8B8QJM3_9MYRT|nr:GDSL esterase/lipase At5g45910-like [Rhodamnia argentea]
MKFMKIAVFILLCCLSSKSVLSSPGRYNAIFNFGNSLSDTGNFLLTGALALPGVKNLPYGETFFHHATGRCSDGRLIIDFIAEAFGLPYLPPYLAVAKGPPIRTGVNFAVVGATALDPSFFSAQEIALWTNDSLSVQLGWFQNMKSSLCTTKRECEEYFKKSLFLVGEIGGNDYIFPFLSGRTVEQLRPLVPQIVGAITRATSMLIEEGAVDLLVPGQFPVGCSALFLTLFQSPNVSAYDPTTGCLKAYNALFQYHDNYLQQELQKLREEYPHARIMYADYYGASVPIYRTPKEYGFYGGALRACCGGGGPYNLNNSARCGDPGSTVCKDPSAFVDWDGIHLTESAYHLIAKGLLYGGFTSPPLLL